ncbi:MAG: Gfo/Idh/MocA family oxidoreductase [Kiritimatiellia bacterium]
MTDHPTTPIAFALVGYGRVAPTHIQALQALGNRARLVAVCDSDPNALARGIQATGAEGHADLQEMLRRDDIDVVSVCTPSGLHAKIGIQAAKAGKHVLMEKPMDVRLDAAQALIDTCSREGVNLYCVFQNRLNSTLQLLKAAIDGGRFGKLYAINSTVIWKRTQDYYDSAAWRGSRAMDGGAFMNQGIHFVDAMRFLFGEISEVKSILGTLDRRIEAEDTGAALFRFENGALGSIFVTMLGPSDQEGSLTVLGEHGIVRIGGTAMNRMDQWDFDRPEPEQDRLAHDADYATKSVYGFGHNAYYARVADHLRTNGPMPTGGKEGIRSLETILRIYTTV